jgi:hypothetical protein
MNGEKTNAYRILVGKPEGKRLLGGPRYRWVDYIKMGLREMGWDGLDRSGSVSYQRKVLPRISCY